METDLKSLKEFLRLAKLEVAIIDKLNSKE